MLGTTNSVQSDCPYYPQESVLGEEEEDDEKQKVRIPDTQKETNTASSKKTRHSETDSVRKPNAKTNHELTLRSAGSEFDNCHEDTEAISNETLSQEGNSEDEQIRKKLKMEKELSSSSKDKPKTERPAFINKVTKSKYIDDRLMNPHRRFPTLTRNIRVRRGKKVEINMPLFMDKNTIPEHYDPQTKLPIIDMDAMAFGMGNCSLQTTFSAIDFKHARHLYDQLSILSPMFLAASAGTCFFKGLITDIDTRWDSIAASVDCRNEEERNPQSDKYIPKSRYESISLYISDYPENLPEYNDYKFPLNQEMMDFARQKAKELGVEIDEKMINHLGFLFSRDALVIYKDKINLDNSQTTAHFENIQSTNWNSMRLKLPPSPDSTIGWRVEFRVMEIQLTDDENAAFSILISIFVRMLYEDWFNLNLYIPMSMNEENFRRANKKDAILNEKFYFRTNIFDKGKPEIQELTAHQIFFGAPEYKYNGIFNEMERFVQEFTKNTNNGQCFSCMNHAHQAI